LHMFLRNDWTYILPSYLIFKCDLNQSCNILYFTEYVFNSGFLSHICHDCTCYGIQYCTHIEALNLYKLAWRWPQCGRNM